MSWNRNNLNMNNHYRNVMARYERGENKVSLKERGFMYSYGDDCEVEEDDKVLVMCKWSKKKTKKKKTQRDKKIDGQ